jgi:hypothetical protein
VQSVDFLRTQKHCQTPAEDQVQLWGCAQDAQEYRNQKGVQADSDKEELS